MVRGESKSKSENSLALHQLPGRLLTDEDMECEHWYEGMPTWPEEGKGGLRASREKWKEVAAKALESASRAYDKSMGSSSEANSRALSREKTLGDKVAAVTLMVQESPVHRLDELRNLLGMTGRKERGVKGLALDAMKDLMINSLLPNRKLLKFKEREYACGEDALEKRHLAYALYEEELKFVYAEFLDILQECASDTVVYFKQKAVSIAFDLLVAKPENEKILLSMLVNKLGDPDRKVSSTASFKLLNLIQKHHPQMNMIVVKEVEQQLLRKNATLKSQYFAVVFLNQIIFSRNDDVELARRILRIYMDLFKACLERKTEDLEKTEKKLSSKPDDSFKRRKKDKKKKKKAKPFVSDEAKGSRLMSALLSGANRAYPYTKPEQDETSYDSHYDALFHVAHARSLAPATQALAFLFQVSQSHSTQSDRFYRALYSRILDAAGAGKTGQAQFLHLVVKAMQTDTNPRRMKAFMKRLLQAGAYGNASFAGACSIVLSESCKGRRFGALKSFVSLPERGDEEETFEDADKNDDSEDDAKEMDEEEARTNKETSYAKMSSNISDRPTEYDASKRDPQFAGADMSSLWEISTFSAHFHPSVSLFAKTLCKELKCVSYEGDPLRDFALMAFLDKFVYKKAKRRLTKALHGKRSAQYIENPLANSKEFQELARDGNIGEDDKFYARFFRQNPSRVQKDIEGETLREDEFEADSEEEAFEKAMMAEMKRLGGGANLNTIADIDGQDEDEMRAFEEAFKDDMVVSGDEIEADQKAEGRDDELQNGNEEADTVIPLNVFEFSDDEGSTSNDDGEMEGESRGDELHLSGKKGKSVSAFASAEDYEDAIAMEAQDEVPSRVGGEKKRRKRRMKTKDGEGKKSNQASEDLRLIESGKLKQRERRSGKSQTKSKKRRLDDAQESRKRAKSK